MMHLVSRYKQTVVRAATVLASALVAGLIAIALDLPERTWMALVVPAVFVATLIHREYFWGPRKTGSRVME
jgi:hypothetical protein